MFVQEQRVKRRMECIRKNLLFEMRTRQIPEIDLCLAQTLPYMSMETNPVNPL